MIGPFTYPVQGEAFGCDVDMMRIVADKMGLELELVNAPEPYEGMLKVTSQSCKLSKAMLQIKL